MYSAVDHRINIIYLKNIMSMSWGSMVNGYDISHMDDDRWTMISMCQHCGTNICIQKQIIMVSTNPKQRRPKTENRKRKQNNFINWQRSEPPLITIACFW